jgi:hypothetical protein
MPSAMMYRDPKPTAAPPAKFPNQQSGLPWGAVLFMMDASWDAGTSATNTKLNSYFRKFNEIIADSGTFYKNSNYSLIALPVNFLPASDAVKTGIFIKGIGAYSATYYAYTGKMYTANADLRFVGGTPFGNLLNGPDVAIDSSYNNTHSAWYGKHGFLTAPLATYDALAPARPSTDKVTILGAAPSDTLSTNPLDVWYKQDQPHLGHYHRVEGSDIAKAVESVLFGSDKFNGKYSSQALYNWECFGQQAILPVVPILRDPKLDNYTTDQSTLPANVLIFGYDITTDPIVNLWVRDQYDPTATPTPDYNFTRHDYNHELGVSTIGDSASSDNSQFLNNSAAYDGVPLYLTTRSTDIGVLSATDNFIRVTASSNTGGIHNHSGTKMQKSTKTGQTGQILQDSGAHTHPVTYDCSIQLKAKWLNGWITLLDETPIPDGCIIAWAPQGGVQTRLPPHWHVCDGTLDTPDLRDYIIAVNMYEDQAGLHGTEVTPGADNKIFIKSYVVGDSTGEISLQYDGGDGFKKPVQTHTHVKGTETGTGTAINDLSLVGAAHGANPARFHEHFFTTASTFAVSTAPTGFYQSIPISATISHNYSPPFTPLLWIMYQANNP